MEHFIANELMPGIFCISDETSVHCTLLCGRDSALLVDTGYGFWDIAAFVKTLTHKPLQVLLTHAHHDHALGARYFEHVGLLPADEQYYDEYTSPAQRKRVLETTGKGFTDLPADYLTKQYPRPEKAKEGAVSLGALTAEVIACPGHTPGSAVIYIPERKLLLSGDNWNLCTWLFFPEALPAEALRENMGRIRKLPFEWVICSHRGELFPRKKMDDFFEGLTDEAMRNAHPVDQGRPIDTREAFPAEGQNFVFDFGKTKLAGK